MDSIRCIKCNSIMALQRSSDADFILHSSRYHYKCSKTKCSNYCVKIFSPSITRSHEMNKQLIGMKYHILQHTGGINVMTDETGTNIDDGFDELEHEFIDNDTDNSTRIEDKVILRSSNNSIERVKLEIEFNINAIIRLTQSDIRDALNKMFEQIDLIELTNELNHSQMNNFKCEIWKQSI